MTRFLFTTAAAPLLLGLAGCPSSEDEGGTNSNDESGSTSADADGSESGDETGMVDESSTGGIPPVELVPVTIDMSMLLPTNYGNQLNDLFGASFTAGSGMGRMRVYARYCADPECAEPVALTQATIDGADENGMYVFSTASTSGTGFDKAIQFSEAPLGTWYMQLIGDTQTSVEWGKGECSDLASCPGDVDVLQIGVTAVDTDLPGRMANPAPTTMEITVTEAGQEIAIEDVQFVGHIHVGGDEIHTPAPSDAGAHLLAAMSNEADSFRNYVAIIALDDASAQPGTVGDDSYILQRDGGDFAGDICGMVRGGGKLFTIGVDNDGAHVFELDGSAGTQLSDTPIASFPPEGDDFPWPCRGIYLEKGGAGHLYLLQYRGAGSLDTSSPSPLYHVNVDSGAAEAPFADFATWAWRGLAASPGGDQLVAVDMSWSKDSVDNGVLFNRLVPIALGGDGTLGAVGTPVVTDLVSDNQCDSQLNWASGATVVDVGGSSQLVVGHDGGVGIFDPTTLAAQGDIDLSGFGILFSQFATSPDATKLYAMPQCKSVTGDSDFELPQGAGTEKSDKNLVAILDLTGDELAVAQTELDINADGTNDNGIDLDYYHLKSYIRGFNSTLPIPPVVYTGPQMAVGASMLFVRGSGIQGNGADTISSSGLGQVQDVGFFDLQTGNGVVFGGYIPFFDGLSSEAGTGTGIWGFDVWPGQESSVGWVEYLPAG